MTWRKTGTEFDDECANVGLSDAAYRTHVEAIGFVYKIENEECRFAKSALRRFATSINTADAIKELIAHGFWEQDKTHYEVIHHADVIRDSLHAQRSKRDRDRAAQRRTRERKDKGTTPSDVSDFVSADPRQTDRQTNKHLEGDQQAACEHGVSGGADSTQWPCIRCTAARRSA